VGELSKAVEKPASAGKSVGEAPKTVEKLAAVHSDHEQPLHTMEGPPDTEDGVLQSAVFDPGEECDQEGFGDADGDNEPMQDKIVVHVEPPESWHADWHAWQVYFVAYCERTKQVLPVKETMSRAERNKRLMRTKKGMMNLYTFLNKWIRIRGRIHALMAGRNANHGVKAVGLVNTFA
jgi:hypothetical protein